MKTATVKGIAAKLMLTGLAAGAFAIAGTTTAQAQQFAVGVQLGNAGYVAVDHDDYRYDADRYRNEEWREHEAREAYARQQAYIAHERWEAEQREAAREAYARQAYFQHEQWERAHRYYDRDDRDHDGDRH